MISYIIGGVVVAATAALAYAQGVKKLRVGDTAYLPFNQLRFIGAPANIDIGAALGITAAGGSRTVRVKVTKIGPQPDYAEGNISSIVNGILPPAAIPTTYFPISAVNTIERNGKQW